MGSSLSQQIKNKKIKDTLTKTKNRRLLLSSIELKQPNNTYTLRLNGRLNIQKIKQMLRVRGCQQIPIGAKLANAKLIHKHGDFYLHVTCFVSPQQLQEHKGRKGVRPDVPKMEAIGLDMGIANQVTCSNHMLQWDANSRSSQTEESLSRVP